MKIRLRKRWHDIALSAALASGLAACGGNTRDFGDAPDASSGKAGVSGSVGGGTSGGGAAGKTGGGTTGAGAAGTPGAGGAMLAGGTTAAGGAPAAGGTSGSGGASAGGATGSGGAGTGGAAAGGATGTGGGGGTPPSDCARRNETHSDPNTGQSWSSVWYCGNDAGARLYEKPNSSNHVGYMDTTTSWFVCYRRGQQHAGANNVWYYTQGDRSTAGWGSRSAWGYMPAVDVHTRVDPNPGIPECAVE